MQQAQGIAKSGAEVQNSGFVLLLTFVSQLRQAETRYLKPYKHKADKKQTTVPLIHLCNLQLLKRLRKPRPKESACFFSFKLMRSIGT